VDFCVQSLLPEDDATFLILPAFSRYPQGVDNTEIAEKLYLPCGYSGKKPGFPIPYFRLL
jgi:metallophosphoesterase superfamily enzyme